jgi:23S rRNA (pseudouridine1915-N3)-methyltransferase
MINLNIIAIGTKMPDWITDGYNEYAKRLNKYCRLTLQEIPLAKRSKTTNTEQAKQAESTLILEKIKPNDYIIALDINSKQYSTPEFANYLNKLSLQTSSIAIMIGGPDGMTKQCIEQAHDKISLSKLTLPHPLVRIILIEQLYRAYSLLDNHPYHK